MSFKYIASGSSVFSPRRKAVVGEVGGGGEILTRLLNAGRTGAAAELVGVGTASMDMTIGYLKQRK
ncbi:MAG: hypothetical protein ABR577_19345, partial [Pyrinomonadaceae bacterium]